MNPNKLDRRLALQAKSSAQTDYGNHPDAWTTVATVFACKEEGTGREFMRARALFETLSVVFTIRYRKDITPRHRIVCDGKTYNILSLTEIGRREWLQINAEEAAT